MKTRFGAVALTAVFLSGCAQDVLNTQPEVRGLEGAAPSQTLIGPETGTNINLRVGGQVRIELAANVTTGYLWEITGINEDALKVVDNLYVSDAVPEGLVGAGGTRVFIFEAISAGRFDLELTHQRSPEDVAEVRVLTVKIDS
ncbi:MAG: protease inhibitor I42 family protein [Pseudomonadota bacterium]